MLKAVIVITLMAGCTSAHRTTTVDGESCERIRVEVNRQTQEMKGPG